MARMTDDDVAALRTRPNKELGFYPASRDPKSIAEYRRKAAEEMADYGRRSCQTPPIALY